MIGIWVWESSVNADLHCESGITCLWGGRVFELWEVLAKGETQVNSRNGECNVCRWSENSAGAGAAKETLPGINRVNTDHITQIISKIMLWKVRRRERVEISASLLSRTVEALESWRGAIGKMGTWGQNGSLSYAEERITDFGGYGALWKNTKWKTTLKVMLIFWTEWTFEFFRMALQITLFYCLVIWRTGDFWLSFPCLFEQRTAGLSPMAGIWNGHMIYMKWLDNSKPQVPQEGYEHPSSKQTLMGLSGSSVAALGIIQIS